MNTTGKLIAADLRRHPARVILTSVAMIAAACMVIWVVSGYDALLGQFAGFASKSFGRYELIVQPEIAAGTSSQAMPGMSRGIEPGVVDELRKDPAVAQAEPVLQGRVSARRIDPETGLPVVLRVPEATPNRPGVPGASPIRPPGMGGPMLVGTDAKEPPYAMVQGNWLAPNQPQAMQAVISSETAKRMQIQLGDSVLVAARGGGSPCQVKIIGIVTEVGSPGVPGQRMMPGSSRGPASAALYVPMALAEDVLGDSLISYIGISLKPEVESDSFRAKWSAILAKANPPLLLQRPQDLCGAQRRHVRRSRAQAGLLGDGDRAAGGGFHHFHHLEHGSQRTHPPVGGVAGRGPDAGPDRGRGRR